MNGHMKYKVLTSAYSREHLIDQGTKNGINWDESKDDGVNWLRFSKALQSFLDANNDFYNDDADKATLTALLRSYTQIRELLKKTMIPHLRAAMSKLVSDDPTSINHPMEYLPEAYKLLDRTGGISWSHKINSLKHTNDQIKHLNKRLGKEIPAQNMPKDKNGDTGGVYRRSDLQR